MSKHTDEDEQAPIEPSKTAIKKQMTALQDLAKNLVALSEKELAHLALPEKILEQIQLARKIHRGSGKKRLIQYIGKLLRTSDVELIQAAFEQLQKGQKDQARAFHQLEQLRDRLISDGEDMIDTVIASYPQADRQQLRQLLRNIDKERSQNKPPTTARKLFKYLRELHENC